jgi:hypothetical protein
MHVGSLLARVPPVLASAALTLEFTAVWTVHAAGADDDGLFLVGALFLSAGLTVATTVVSLVTLKLRSIRRPPC